MAAVLNGFLDRLARGMAGEALADRSDADLLGRLRAGPDPAGFAAVVRRHGPMVYRVCRRVLRHEADAEDAFQATFLVFARNLRKVRRPAALAAWLHGVALRTALRARSAGAIRRRAERQGVRPEVVATDDRPWGELRAVLDEELARLPERWRLPLVLCHLEGRTQDEAAAQLGWPRITLRRRLDEARAALGRRLVRRGFGPAAVAAALVADCLTAGAAPSRLLDSVAAYLTTAGRAGVPAGVSHLAQTVSVSMTTPFRFKISAAVLAAGVLVAGGWLTVGTVPDQLAAQDKPPTKSAEEPAETPKPVKIDLAGDWRLAMPAGFEHDIKLTALPGDRFRFQSKGLVFNGVYERKGDKLVMAEPTDKTQTGFEWEIRPGGRLVLVRNSDARSGDYLGASLSRAGAPAGPKRATEDKADRPVAPERPAPAAKTPAVPVGRVRVSGWLVSTEYGKMSGTVDRVIVYVLRGSKGLDRFVDPATKKEAYWNTPAGRFTFDLPPGTYRVQCTAVGSRGATFEPTYKEFTIKAGDEPLALGAIDLPVSKVTKLFGHPAPELTGVVAWKNTDPLTLKDLKGQVVVIDFWSYACSICHHYKPDLVRLADRYKGKGLTVITLHDNSVATVGEMDKLMEPVVQHAWKGKPLGLPIGIDGKGSKSVFQAYGVHAVPTVLLIDRDGKVVRRFAHAGDPELEQEVAKLLAK